MCFSANASFIAAAVTGTIGVISLARVNHPRELALAATPILFAVQQGVEGCLWLSLPTAPDGAISSGLALAYLLFAQGLWPVYAPITVLLIEPSAIRRRLIWPWLAVGAATAFYLLWALFTRPFGAHIQGDHIAYATNGGHTAVIAVGYLGAVSLPLLLSSRRILAVLGVIVLVGCVVAYVFYREAALSVWCFFAAVASMVILGHFEWARRRHLQLAST